MQIYFVHALKYSLKVPRRGSGLCLRSPVLGELVVIKRRQRVPHKTIEYHI
jgi:hypothetical protein